MTVRQNNGHVTISVANSGLKLSQDELGRIFDPFWRSDTARTAAGLHSGLGLALTQRIMSVLNGSIKASRESGDTFRVDVIL